MSTSTGRRRVCFVLRVRPDRIEEYEERHARVWPSMREALAAAGWHNYSLFSDGRGTVIGYLETDDFDRARAAMAGTEVNAFWQAEMAPLFEPMEGRPDEGMVPLTEIFHLP
ncbi:L-rhamnose mutarotase [Nocardiopsis xinjiangensis]|uniref:L-rhamnose mutarotase n=1 Tax=Nocardiopsis xinjiangensis TaxID=124285 RepID=UPI000346A1FC|nr:L-rhamnose mutarotase [Nocardiopsis xinjiangensis]